jgi:hypothetical protein
MLSVMAAAIACLALHAYICGATPRWAAARAAAAPAAELAIEQAEAADAEARGSTLLREAGALRELYRAGDATGTAWPLDSSGASMAATVLAEAVLHPRGAVVLAINTAAVNDTYNDICCALDVVACHFTFVDSLVASLAVTLPPGFASVADAFGRKWR